MKNYLFKGKVETLFKAKIVGSGRDGEWYEGLPFWMMWDGQEVLCISSGAIVANDYGDILGDWYRVYEDTLCRYIGLTDAEGNKIFNGDIVHVEKGVSEPVDISVRWVEELAGYSPFVYCGGSLIKPSDVHVMGNIHDEGWEVGERTLKILL